MLMRESAGNNNLFLLLIARYNVIVCCIYSQLQKCKHIVVQATLRFRAMSNLIVIIVVCVLEILAVCNVPHNFDSTPSVK